MTIKEYAGDDVGFAAWLERVDIGLTTRYGLGVLDLPDQNYYDMYEDEYTVSEVIEEMQDNGDLW